MKTFLSYSHADAGVVARLKTHLKQMERNELISVFYDREILAGGDIDNSISVKLNEAELFLAVVSPDFLNSHYCYDKEMQRALELHDEGRMIVVPIIAEPCDWKNSPLGRLKAVPKDGKEISEWQNANSAYMDIVSELRRIAESPPAAPVGRAPVDQSKQMSSGPSRFRVKRAFDAVDRINFREHAFGVITEYFRHAVDELSAVAGIKGIFRQIGPYSFTATLANEGFGKRGVSHITVHMGTSGGLSLGDVSWSNSENAPSNTSHGHWSVGNDDYDQFLTGGSFMMSSEGKKLTPTQAAEQMWKDFMERAGVSYA
ncbi:MAG: toll/interleukin-1 receptor domain-containing protein [Hyphomonas sp.]|uniref:toll/interleukin-1 receptor domain-containing protein n=1 Tax=Hyphomonas sp. TaxID=87 RepID=UPI001825D0D0|nr:toll/interleukin-1 receptor domain-containing protein [Hyphomonas sp.]MBA3068444.1 toll/interleukin-1 receptor domain-containing protein [Hyphomonas sp.]MBU3920470.1 toll/interleukin-1 receptor domain-containing protein [Alphaproteobacteria bacterium]MBU4060689.1 toll/interleukin-1 receptor domain-containing protein [Alphaproteobacteria bacterium]MBU4164673.1 toll/interleukin-1 receptor domain-containing protein [Alphaproteobacteria bacterium]